MPRRTTHDNEYAELGRRIRELRQGQGWTQVELAEHAGLSPGYVAELERGGRNPSLETILNLAAALNVSAGYLVDGMRYEAPAGMGRLAECWPSLTADERRALVHLASLFVVRRRIPPSSSASVGKKRARTSK